MANAIYIQKNSRNTKLHYTIQVLSLLASLGAFYVIFTQKIMLGKSHFTTIHGKLGLVLNILFTFMSINAFVALNLKLPFGNPHKIFGRVVFTLGLIEMYLGISTMRPNDYLLQGGFIVVSLFFLFMILKPKEKVKQQIE